VRLQARWTAIVTVTIIVAGFSMAAGTVRARAQAPATPSADEEGRPSFTEFLASVHAEAIERGIKPEVVDAALDGLQEPLPIVLERDRAQAEAVLSLEHYITRRLTTTLVKNAREGYTKQRKLLGDVSMRYGVAPEIIVAIWGVESNFGRFTGVRPTVAALATLAWDPRRSTLFRGELMAALEILNQGDVPLSQLKGSWAGAMGQPQFMPSSYLKFAEDFDGDGRRDIWGSTPDVFASIANYLKGHGWATGQTWGREVKVSEEGAARISSTVARREGTCRAKREMTVPMLPSEWRELGVTQMNGSPLADEGPSAMVSGETRHFLVYQDYDAILEYNCSHAYAISVGLLANKLAPSPGRAKPRASVVRAQPEKPPIP
jgi:membrane-bound lytic murein transglycosylase B